MGSHVWVPQKIAVIILKMLNELFTVKDYYFKTSKMYNLSHISQLNRLA